MQLTAQINTAAAVGKPLLLGEYGKLPPVGDRNIFVEMVGAFEFPVSIEFPGFH